MTDAKIYIRFLRQRGVLPASTPEGNCSPLLTRFRTWMREHRGVTDVTLDVYQYPLEELLTSLGSDPSSYRAEMLRAFVVQRGKRHGVSYAKLGATAVRSFIRYLAATNQCSAGLRYAIPAWRSWTLSSTPKYLSPKDVNRLIGHPQAADAAFGTGQ